jgi:hypothetical protein
MHKMPSPSVVRLAPCGFWDFIAESSAIKRWTTELAVASTRDFCTEIWDVLGHAVLIESDDVESVRTLVHHIAGEGNMQLHVIDRDQMMNYKEWMKAISVDEPTLVYLEPGLWLKNKLGDEDSNLVWAECPTHDDDKAYGFRKALAEFIETQSCNRPTVFVTSVESVSQLDASLRRAGLFDRRVKVPELEYEDVARAFIQETGAELLDDSIHSDLKRVGCLVRNEFPDHRRRCIFQKAIKRLAWRNGGTVAYKDLVQFAAYGTAEVDDRLDPPEVRRRHAVHEAGHALITYLDSKDKTPPEYCSVIKRGGTHGIMVSAFEAHERISDDLSFQDVTHNIRVNLGGRVAEHLLLGAHDASGRGARGDLRTATNLAGSLFGNWGHSEDQSSDTAAASNLAVCVGKPSNSEYEHVEKKIRDYLQMQFGIVLEIFKANQVLLEMIVTALNEKTFLVKEDFLQLVKAVESKQ